MAVAASVLNTNRANALFEEVKEREREHKRKERRKGKEGSSDNPHHHHHQHKHHHHHKHESQNKQGGDSIPPPKKAGSGTNNNVGVWNPQEVEKKGGEQNGSYLLPLRRDFSNTVGEQPSWLLSGDKGSSKNQVGESPWKKPEGQKSSWTSSGKSQDPQSDAGKLEVEVSPRSVFGFNFGFESYPCQEPQFAKLVR